MHHAQSMIDRSYTLKEGWGNLSQTIRVRIRLGIGFMAYATYILNVVYIYT